MIIGLSIVSYVVITLSLYFGVLYFHGDLGYDYPPLPLIAILWPISIVIIALWVIVLAPLGWFHERVDNWGENRREKLKIKAEETVRLAALAPEELLLCEQVEDAQADLDYRNMHCQSCGKPVVETLSE